MEKVQDQNSVQINEGIQDFDNKILPNHFNTIIVGKPGCGKSNLIAYLLNSEKAYYKCFDKVLFITPSTLPGDIILNEDNSTKKLDSNWILQKLQNIDDQFKKLPVQRRNVLIVLDDCVSEIKKQCKEGTFLNALFFNRRHMLKDTTISIILTTQKYNLIPTSIRNVATNLFIFSTSQKDIQNIKDDQLYDYIESYKQIMKQVCGSVNHDFLHISLKPLKLFMNWQLIMPPQYHSLQIYSN